MSSQERIEQNMYEIENDLKSLDQEIQKINKQLESKDLSEENKTLLESKLTDCIADRTELYTDLAMLEELLHKMEMSESRTYPEDDYYDSNYGLDWNESGYFD